MMALTPTFTRHWQAVQPVFSINNEDEYDAAIERLNSFDNFFSDSSKTKEQFAEAGFFFTGKFAVFTSLQAGALVFAQ